MRGRWRVPNLTGCVQAFLLVLLDRSEKTAALVSALLAELATGTRGATAVEIATRFTDGSVVITTNADRLRPFPPLPGATVAQLPSVRDASTLDRVHRMLVRRLDEDRGRTPRVRDDPGEASGFVASLLEDKEKQAAAGRMRLTSDGTAYRMTWKGAALLSWNRLWPFSTMRRARLRRRERGLLREADAFARGETPAARAAVS